GYGWFTIVAPILVAAPAYFNSGMTFGELMMLVGAFNQVQQSLRWFVDNFPTIADWRASVSRVSEFRDALRLLDSDEGEAEQIKLEPHGMGNLSFENVSVLFADGKEVISEATAHIVPG